MVFARLSGMRRITVREREEAQEEEYISVFPLTIPLVAGPGSLTKRPHYTDNGGLLVATRSGKHPAGDQNRALA